MDLTQEASNNATVEPNGPRSGSNGKRFFNVQGGDNGNFAEYGVVDFNFGSLPATVTTIDVIAIELTQDNAGFSNSGTLNFYLDTTEPAVGIEPGSSPLAFDGTDEGITQDVTDGDLTLLSIGSGTHTITSTGDTDSFSLTLDSTSEAFIIDALNNSDTFRIVITGNGGVAGTFAGYTNPDREGPTLKITTDGDGDPIDDTTPPTLQTLSPAPASSQVAVSTTLALSFNEPVMAGSGNLTIYEMDGDVLVETIAVGSALFGGQTATFTPTAELDFETSYYLLLDDGAIQDMSGNAFGGIQSTSFWFFSTSDAPDLIGPTGFRLVWNDDPTSTMTIGWFDDGGTDPHIDFGTDPNGSDWTRADVTATKVYDADGSVPGNLVPEGAPLTSRFVDLTGLVPDTAYYFQVTSGTNTSDTIWFKTAPDVPSDFTFIAGGDSRDASGEVLSNQAPRTYGFELVAKLRPLFVAYGGDYISRFNGGATNLEWRRWMREWQMTRSQDGRMYPIVPAHGNHENDVIEAMNQIFNMRDGDGPSNGEDAYNSLGFGDNQLRLYTLNTELEPLVGYNAYEELTNQQIQQNWDDQTTWMTSDMAANAANATWVVANYHRPIRPHRASKDEGLLRYSDWGPLFNQYVDVAVECDTHLPKFTYPLTFSLEDGHYEGFVRDDANGILFTGEGSWGAPLRPSNDLKPWTLSAGMFWQFKLFHVQNDPQKLKLYTVIFNETLDSRNVTALTQTEQDNDGLAMPDNINLWETLVGDVIELPFEQLPIDQTTFVPTNAIWAYSDLNTDLGSDWIETDFDDTNWSTGQAAFGFGDESELTIPRNTPPKTTLSTVTNTAYFRHSFNLTQDQIDSILKLTAYYRYDDGLIVYVNGQEAFRVNMAPGDQPYPARALSSRDRDADGEFPFSPGEESFESSAIRPELLAVGENVIAVSVHQANSTAAQEDMSFEMTLSAVISSNEGIVPDAPSNMRVGDGDGGSVQVTWDGQFDGDIKGYQIEYRPDDGEWILLRNGLEQYDPISDDIPLSFFGKDDTSNFLHFPPSGVSSLDYRARAYNVNGRSEYSSIVTYVPSASAPAIVSEDFETQGSLGIFTSFDDGSSPDANWGQLEWNFGDDQAAGINTFGSASSISGEDWLILRDPIDFSNISNATFEIGAQIRFNGPTPQILYSEDYVIGDPDNPNDPRDGYNWETFGEIPTNVGTSNFPLVGPLPIEGVQGNAHFAILYPSNGGGAGNGVELRIDDFAIRGIQTLDSESFANDLGNFTTFDAGSSANWSIGDIASLSGATIDAEGSDAAAVDWLIGPATLIDSANGVYIAVDIYIENSDVEGLPLSILYSTNFAGGDPSSANWIDVTGTLQDQITLGSWTTVFLPIVNLTSGTATIAFLYETSGVGQETSAQVGIRNFSLREIIRPSVNFLQNATFGSVGDTFNFTSNLLGGVPPIQYYWLFGDGRVAVEPNPSIAFVNNGQFDVTLTVTDSTGAQSTVSKPRAITILEPFVDPNPVGMVRIATFNTSLAPDNNEDDPVVFFSNLSDPDYQKGQDTAEIIQRINPDIILLNEFNYPDPDLTDVLQAFKDSLPEGMVDESSPLENLGVDLFRKNFLEAQIADGVEPIFFPYVYVARSNTGIATGLDFSNDGNAVTDEFTPARAEDSYGFGVYPGHYAQAILSKFPILTDEVRTFQLFRWKDMPDALIPEDPEDFDNDGDLFWYNSEELDVFRLSSKTHWDVPVNFKGYPIHILASHPTPPTFDDPGSGNNWQEGVDHNGRRNHDEIRFFADYIDPILDDYIYDDQQWIDSGNQLPANPEGGLGANKRFVIMGDQNADPVDGDATRNPINLIRLSDYVDVSIEPESDGADEAIPSDFSNRRTKTSDFLLRADYALPSQWGFTILDAQVFWPIESDPLNDLIGGSDHRLVWLDLQVDREGQQAPILSFNDWQTAYGFFIEASVGRNVDLDLDGLTTEQEFFFVSNPNDASSRNIPAIRADIQQNVELLFRFLDVPNVGWRVRMTDDLSINPDSWPVAQSGTDYSVTSTSATDDPNAIDIEVEFNNDQSETPMFFIIEPFENLE